MAEFAPYFTLWYGHYFLQQPDLSLTEVRGLLSLSISQIACMVLSWLLGLLVSLGLGWFFFKRGCCGVFWFGVLEFF